MQKKKNDLNKTYIKNVGIGVFALLIYFILPSFEKMPFTLLGINLNTVPDWIKILYQILFESVLILIMCLLFRDSLKKDFVDMKKNHQKYFSTCLKYWFIALGVMMFSNLIINTISSNGIAGNEQNIRALFSVSPIYIFFSAVIYAPIVEELTFRKSIRNIFKTDTLFIIVSGLLFGALHVATNFQTWTDLLYIIPYSAPGFAFAYMLKKYDNILVTMGFHFMHNGILVALQFIILLFG